LCNLYSLTKGQPAIRELVGAMRDRTGNLPPLPGIFPDYAAPIVRNQPDGRELMMARWGMPSPVFALKGKKSDPGSPMSGEALKLQRPVPDDALMIVARGEKKDEGGLAA